MRMRQFVLPAAVTLCLSTLAVVTANGSKSRPEVYRQASDTAAIVRFAQDLASAIRSQNVDRIMSHYARNDLLVYDSSPPYLYTSWQALQESWRKEFAGIDSLNQMEMRAIHARASGDLGYFSARWHSEVILRNGSRESADGCMTDILQKDNGRWLIVHEHDSLISSLPAGVPGNGGGEAKTDFVDPAYRGDGRSGIEGTVMAGPIRPVSRPGESNERPLANRSVSIRLAANGADIARTHTDAKGHFRLALTPGDYQIVPHGAGIYDRPWPATVRAGAFTHLTIHYDTGIR